MKVEPLNGMEKIVLAAWYWKQRGYTVDGWDYAELIQAIEEHFGTSAQR